MKSPQSLAVGSGNMKSCICLVVALMALLITQSHASAALVINSVVTNIDNSNPLTSTVNVSLFGVKDTTPAIENVSSFAVSVTVTGVSPTILGAANAVGSQWSAFNNIVSPDISGSTVTFRAFSIAPPSSVPITGTSQGATTLIGTFSFTVNKTGSSQSFNTTASKATQAPGVVGLGPPPTGFLFIDPFFVEIPTTLNTVAPAISGGTITPTAVPEPSSLALLGLVSAGGYIVRRRRAAKVS